MANQAANVTSTDAVRALKVALQKFAEDAANALIQLDLESRRALDWIENDRSRYWPQEERKASGAVSEARLALERAEVTTGDEHRYCIDERKALEKAKRRQRLAEEKTQAVKRWRMEIQKEVQNFQVQLAKLTHYLDGDFLKSLAALERIVVALDRYVQRQTPSGAESGGSS